MGKRRTTIGKEHAVRGQYSLQRGRRGLRTSSTQGQDQDQGEDVEGCVVRALSTLRATGGPGGGILPAMELRIEQMGGDIIPEQI